MVKLREAGPAAGQRSWQSEHDAYLASIRFGHDARAEGKALPLAKWTATIVACIVAARKARAASHSQGAALQSPADASEAPGLTGDEAPTGESLTKLNRQACQVATACAKASCLQQAAWILDQVSSQGGALDREALSFTVLAFARQRLLREALSWQETATAQGLILRPECYQEVTPLTAQKDVRPHQSGLPNTERRWWRTVQSMKEMGCWPRSDDERAQRWLEAATASRLQPDAQTYETVIHSYQQAKDPFRASEWLWKALESGVVIQSHIVHSLVRLCCFEGLVSHAERIAESCRSHRVALSDFTYHALCRAFALQREEAKLRMWLDKALVDGAKPQLAPYDIASAARAKEGDMAGAEAWLAEAQALGLELSALSYSHMIAGYAKTGRAEEAENWLARMRDAGFSPTSSVYIALMQAAVGRTDRVEYWLQRILAEGLQPGLTGFALAIAAFANDGDAAGAAKWLEAARQSVLPPPTQAVSYAVGLQPVPPAPEAGFNAVIQLYAKQGSARSAGHWLSEMLRDKLLPDRDSFNAVISAYAKLGDLLRAEGWLRVMEGSPPSLPSVETYNGLFDGCSRSGKVAEAVAWFDRMQGAGVEPDVISYRSIMACHARAGDLTGAVQWFQRLVNTGLNPGMEAYNILLMACSRQKDVRRAELWLQKARSANFEPDQFSYNTLINTCVAAEDMERAQFWLKQMKEDRCAPGPISFTPLITAAAKDKDSASAFAWLEQMREADLEPDVVAWTAALKSCDAGEAEVVLSQMLKARIKPNDVTRLELVRIFGAKRARELFARFLQLFSDEKV